MPDPTPRLSVLMCVYNGEEYLASAIESVLNQTLRDFEFIIVDDASTDSSLEIIQEFADKDDRIVIVSNPENLGLTKSLNRGLERATGKIIARQDADDLSKPDRFRRQLDFLKEHPEVVLVGSWYEAIDNSGKKVDEYIFECENERIARLLIQNTHFGHGAAMFRRLPDLTYDERFRTTQDYDLFTRLTLQGKVANLPEILYSWRTHSSNITSRKSKEQDKNRQIISNKYISGLVHANRLDTVLGACFEDLLLLERMIAVKTIVSEAIGSGTVNKKALTNAEATVLRSRGRSTHLLRLFPLLMKLGGIPFAIRWLISFMPRCIAHVFNVMRGQRMDRPPNTSSNNSP